MLLLWRFRPSKDEMICSPLPAMSAFHLGFVDTTQCSPPYAAGTLPEPKPRPVQYRPVVVG